MNGRLSRFLKVVRRPEGQAMPEYALLVGFIALVLIIATTAVGVALRDFFTSVVPGFG